jgi:hypothetical protein
MKNLTQEELTTVQEIHNSFNKAKMDLGDHVLQRRALIDNIDMLRGKFAEVEKELIDKYGKDAVIDLQTGEVKSKEEADATKEIVAKAKAEVEEHNDKLKKA